MKAYIEYMKLNITNVRFLLSTAGAVLIVYFLIWLLRGSMPSPWVLPYWMVAGGFGLLTGSYLTNLRRARLEAELREKLEDKTNETFYRFYNADGAFLGDVAREDYLIAEFIARIDTSVWYKQALNFLWGVFSLFVRVFYVMPVTMVMIGLLVAFFEDSSTLADITLGQLIASGFLTQVFMLSSVAVLLAFVFKGRLPGSKDIYGIRLQGALSKSLPNIANANGYWCSVVTPTPSKNRYAKT